MAFLPKLTVNTEGWGPVGEIENVFPDIPYATFSKSDKLGKAADWTISNRPHQIRPGASAVATAFNAFDDEDEEDYSLVDTRPQKKQYGKKIYTKPQPKIRQSVRGGVKQTTQGWQQQQQRGKTGGRAKKNQARYYQSQYSGYNARQGKKFMPSVEVLPQWGDPVLVVEFSTLQNLDKIKPPEAETVVSCGRLEKYNAEVYDKLSVRHERPLEKTERRRYQVTTEDDPILGKLAEKENFGNVFATDAILAVLMCATKSMYSWDLIVRKVNGKIFLEKRDESTFDYLTVNENASEPPADDEPGIPSNSVDELHKEATFLNFSFSQQLLIKDDDKSYKFPDPNPFNSSQDLAVASMGYFYRKWDLGDGITLVARTEVDGYKSDHGKPAFLVIKALNEYDTKITGGWRSKLESQKAGCFATEVKNNGNKLAKWTVQANLAGADEIKLGYVSRINPRDQYNHVILAITTHKPQDFARELGVDLGKLWTGLKFILGELQKLEDGKYIILREGTKKQLLVYRTDQEE